MKAFVCVPQREGSLGQIILAAFARSFNSSQVERADANQISAAASEKPVLAVFANPGDDCADAITKLLGSRGTKVAVFGRVGELTAALLGVRVNPLPRDMAGLASCEPARRGQSSQSELWIRYLSEGLARLSPVRVRPLQRFDFAAEWNNLGYGTIGYDGSMWSLAHLAYPDSAIPVAQVTRDATTFSIFTALLDLPHSSALWINRGVGTLDSQEWRLVESFFSSYRSDKLTCLPMILECPWGYESAATMRLDCDEDVASASALYSLYRKLGVPFSLAVKTDLLENPRHAALLAAVAKDGGSLLSHSASHPANWGEDYARAFDEARRSAAALDAIAGRAGETRYAVSPFHQNPPHAVQALADAGYRGFVGGIVSNDPEYLLARAGEVADGPPGFISHSQQCMLHGDCVLDQGDPLATYKESFRIAKGARSIFGYLDHPFSERYQYGWNDETQRCLMHEKLITHMRSSGRTLFMSENDALDFIRARAQARFHWRSDGRFLLESERRPFAIEYRGETTAASEVAA